MILNSNLSKMKNKILPTCLQGSYRDSLGEFSNASYSLFGAERVKGSLFGPVCTQREVWKKEFKFL